MKNAAAKIANVFSSAAVSLPAGKKFAAMIGRQESVDGEVEPFDGVADRRTGDDPAQC